MPSVAMATASATANHKSNLFVATGWPKGNWKFNIVVGDKPGMKLYLYVDDGNSYQATVNHEGWATFKKVDLSGALNQDATDGKLSFTEVINGHQKPINYTQRYYASSDKMSFSALYTHPTANITDIQNGCDSTNEPYITLTVTNPTTHDMAYDITVSTYGPNGKKAGSENGIMELTAGQSLPDQWLSGSTTGTCGATTQLTSVNAYNDTNDNGQPDF